MAHHRVIELCRRIADEATARDIDLLLGELRALLAEETEKLREKIVKIDN